MSDSHGLADNLFENRTVVVTGAGRGIGWAVARAFADLGAELVAHAGREDRATLDFAKTVVVGDLSTPQGAETLAGEIARACERIDVLAPLRGHARQDALR